MWVADQPIMRVLMNSTLQQILYLGSQTSLPHALGAPIAVNKTLAQIRYIVYTFSYVCCGEIQPLLWDNRQLLADGLGGFIGMITI